MYINVGEDIELQPTISPPSQANETTSNTATTTRLDKELTTTLDHTDNQRAGALTAERDICPTILRESIADDGGAASAQTDPGLPQAHPPLPLGSTGDVPPVSSVTVDDSEELADAIEEGPLQQEPPSEQGEMIRHHFAHHESANIISATAAGYTSGVAVVLNFANPALTALDESSNVYAFALTSRSMLYLAFVTGFACGIMAAAMAHTSYVSRGMIHCCVIFLVAAFLEGLGGVVMFVMTLEDTALSVAVIMLIVVCSLFILVCALNQYRHTRSGMLDVLRSLSG
ncbi:hypothetical protein PLICRDRAFT_41484 [Plicaturopsis crispa FD-325 SS-3]|nr:hypothetical protein PLICRDRAFT_41484 [Plicaturopsis crispa FD-325 SS-3]